MRTTRRLTSNERWELGLFLSMLIVGFLLLTVFLNLSNLPRLFAFSSDSPAPAADTAVITPPQPQPTIDVVEAPAPAPVMPQVQALPAPAVPAQIIAPAPAPKPAVKKPAPDIKVYKGQKYIYVKTLKLRVTAYAPDARCCWPYPGTTTATGQSVKTNGGRLVAADPNLIPMHSLVAVPGYAGGSAVPVLDTGGDIKGHRLDVLLPNFDTAKNWGSRNLEVKIYKPIDD